MLPGQQKRHEVTDDEDDNLDRYEDLVSVATSIYQQRCTWWTEECESGQHAAVLGCIVCFMRYDHEPVLSTLRSRREMKQLPDTSEIAVVWYCSKYACSSPCEQSPIVCRFSSLHRAPPQCGHVHANAQHCVVLYGKDVLVLPFMT